MPPCIAHGRHGRPLRTRFRQSDIAERQFMRRDDTHAALAGRDEDQFSAAADDADLEGFLG